MRGGGNGTWPLAVMGGLLLGIGLFFSWETARFLDQGVAGEGTVRFAGRSGYLVDSAQPDGRMRSLWVSGSWTTSLFYRHGDRMAFVHNPTMTDRDWIPLVGSFFPSARVFSWASLWLSGVLFGLMGVGCLTLAWLATKFPVRVRVRISSRADW